MTTDRKKKGNRAHGANGRFVSKEAPENVAEGLPEPDPVTERLWTIPQWALILWEATPSMERDPISQKALAEKLGVTEQTIGNWKRIPEYWVEVRAIAKRYLNPHIADIYYALAQKARQGSILHIKLALELLGEYVEHHDVTSGGKPFPVQTFDYGATIAQITAGPGSDN